MPNVLIRPKVKKAGSLDLYHRGRKAQASEARISSTTQHFSPYNDNEKTEMEDRTELPR